MLVQIVEQKRAIQPLPFVTKLSFVRAVGVQPGKSQVGPWSDYNLKARGSTMEDVLSLSRGDSTE
jgi:hypothetical protein